MLEATAFGIRHLLEAVREAGGEAKRLVAVGGGTRGGLWTQIVSDVIGMPQELPEQTIGPAYGNALLAGIGGGIVGPDTDWTSIAETVEPNPENRETYDSSTDSTKTSTRPRATPSTPWPICRPGRASVLSIHQHSAVDLDDLAKNVVGLR